MFNLHFIVFSISSYCLLHDGRLVSLPGLHPSAETTPYCLLVRMNEGSKVMSRPFIPFWSRTYAYLPFEL
eukprot:c43769_g1_i1 orf=641-850(+)